MKLLITILIALFLPLSLPGLALASCNFKRQREVERSEQCQITCM